MEIWRPIKNYEGLYEVSNFGRIRSLDRLVKHSKGGTKIVRGRIKASAKPHPKTGYLQVGLYKNGKGRTITIHRLVAFAFPEICGEYFDGAVVDHLDTVRQNNRAKNLRWCTISENHLNPITYEREKENLRKAVESIRGKPAWNRGKTLPQQSGESHWHSKPILQLDRNGNVIKRWVNVAQAAKGTGILTTSLYNCLQGRSRSAGGWLWEYV